MLLRLKSSDAEKLRVAENRPAHRNSIGFAIVSAKSDHPLTL